MPVSGFTVAHDFEAQAYNKQRAAYLAAEKERKRAEKASKEAAKRDLRAMQKGMKQIEKNCGTHWTRLFRSSRLERKVVTEKIFEDDDSSSDEIPLKSALAM